MWLVINTVRDFLIIVAYNFKDIVKKESFKIFTIVMTVLLFIGIFLTNFFLKYDFSNKRNDYLIYIVDKENHIFNNHLDINIYMNNMENLIKNKYYFEFLQKDINREFLDQELNSRKIDGYIVVNSSNNIDIVTSRRFTELNYVLDKFILNKHMEGLINPENINNLKVDFNIQVKEINKNKIKTLIETYTIPIVFMFFIYILLIMYGQFISISVNLEKNSKMFEILLTKVRLSNIILGKIVGIMLAALIQLIYFIFIIYGSIFLLGFTKGSLNGMINISFIFILRYIVYFILGFLIYSFMFFRVGSYVSKTEDLPINLAPTMCLISISYFVGNICLQFSQYSFIPFLKYIPFFTPFSVFFNTSIHWINELVILFILISFIILLFLFNVRTVGKKLVRK